MRVVWELLKNFFDPLWTSDGKPYGRERYKQIVQERYVISKQINTSYSDLSEVTPQERTYLLNFILDDLKRQEETIQKFKEQKGRK